MLCVICHSPDIERTSVQEEIRVNSDMLLVPITIPVCNQCGERYYDRKTMQQLERVKEQLRLRRLATKVTGKVLLIEEQG